MSDPPAPRTEPRISANDLARFMISSDTARMGIIRRAKAPKKPPLIRYRDVRPVLCAFLADPSRRVNPLAIAEQMFSQRAEDPAQKALAQDDARQSIEVLHAIQRMQNKLNTYQFALAPERQKPLILSGVTVSVRADLIVSGPGRTSSSLGAAVLRMTQDDADSDDAIGRRREMGYYVAVLARLHAERNLSGGATVPPRLCLSIDVRHGEVFAAPSSTARRVSDLDNACRVIAALWSTL